MAIGPYIFKQKYKDLSVQELEEKYNNLKNVIRFTSKEMHIKFMAENFLNTGMDSYYTEKKVLEDILKMKTGKDYYFESISYDGEIETSDLINYVSKGDEFKKKVLDEVLNSLYDNSTLGYMIIDGLSIYAGEVIKEIQQADTDVAVGEIFEDKLEDAARMIIDKKQKEFLFMLYSDKELYKNFFVEAADTTDYVLLFIKYYLILDDYRSQHTYIC